MLTCNKAVYRCLERRLAFLRLGYCLVVCSRPEKLVLSVYIMLIRSDKIPQKIIN